LKRPQILHFLAVKLLLVQITLKCVALNLESGSVRREVIIASGSAWSSDYSLHPLHILACCSYKFVRK
jgi:hypothetical protein